MSKQSKGTKKSLIFFPFLSFVFSILLFLTAYTVSSHLSFNQDLENFESSLVNYETNGFDLVTVRQEFSSFVSFSRFWHQHLWQKKIPSEFKKSLENEISLQKKDLSEKKMLLQNLFNQVSAGLTGVEKQKGGGFFDLYTQFVEKEKIDKAREVLERIEKEILKLMENQEDLFGERLSLIYDQIQKNILTGEEVFADMRSVKEELTLIQRYQSDRSASLNLTKAKNLLEESAEIIAQRKKESEEAEKSILVVLSEKKLYMRESGKEIYSMPVSSGNAGHPTRTGQFRVLNKIEKVWGYYQIWMPYWMGIYFAGSSENGIHGIPWDSAGNRYWDWAIGGYDVTYGCVMPNDADVKRLFNWAEIGVPVRIIK